MINYWYKVHVHNNTPNGNVSICTAASMVFKSFKSPLPPLNRKYIHCLICTQHFHLTFYTSEQEQNKHYFIKYFYKHDSLTLSRECMAKSGPSCAFTDFWRVESFHMKTLPSLPPEKLMSAAFPNATHSMSHDLETFPKVPRVEVKPPPEIDPFLRNSLQYSMIYCTCTNTNLFNIDYPVSIKFLKFNFKQ